MKKHLVPILLVLVCLPGLAALAQAGNDETSPGRFTVRETCPVSLTTAKVELRDTSTGIAVSFTAAPAEVAELRRRVELLARKHRAAVEESVDVERMPAGAMKYESIPDGARLVLTPMDPARLTMFRSRVHTLVEKMREGDCEIMPEIR